MRNRKSFWLIEGVVVIVVLAALLTMMIPKFLQAQKNINTPRHFPDPIFRSIAEKALKVQPSQPFIKEDAEKLTGKLDCREKKIKSLKGIEYFPRISVLDCSKNELTELDISKNTALENFFADFNQIKVIDLSLNPRLRTVGLTSNQAIHLDVSNLPNLSMLYCGGNQLTHLDLSKNVRLTDLNCPGNQLTDLDLTAQYTLGMLNCSSNRLKTIKFHPQSPVSNLFCAQNQFQELDLSNLAKLGVLYCDHNQLSRLDISKNPDLGYINISNNNLTDVQCFLGHPTLQYADVRFNRLTFDQWDDLMKLKTQLDSKPASSLREAIEAQKKTDFLDYSPQQGIDPFEKK